MIGISEIMRRDIITMSKKTSVEEAALLMLNKGISSALVEEKGKVIGIITDKDFVRLTSMKNRPKCVNGLMSTELITIDPDSGLLEAIKLMEKHKLRHLLVKERQKIVGIISLKDIMRAVSIAALL
jgi:CBS domain-containing protein